MQPLSMHKKFYQIKKIDDSDYSPEVYEKYEKIRLFFKLKSEGCSEKTALEAIKIPKSTLYKWSKRYKKRNLAGLENESRRPNNIRKPKYTLETEKLVVLVRKKYRLWGKEKIAIMIKKEYGKVVSASMVGRIMSKFINRGILKRVSFYHGKKDTRRRLFNGHAQRWLREMKATHPGELVQVDHMDIKLISEAHVKHFQAICPITKIAVMQAYNRATSNSASDFLKMLIERFPFKVKSIQVDGGAEFMGDFEQSCKIHNIDLFVLPPRSPEYNCYVERCNGTAKYEFYYQYSGSSALNDIQEGLQNYVKMYSTVRPHQALSYLTPMEYFGQLKV